MNLATHGRRRAHSVCSHQAIDGSRKECTSPAGALGFADLIPRRSWAQRQVTAGMVPASPLEARERVPTMRGRIQMREANAHGAPSLRRQRRRCLEGKQRLRCATRCRTRSTVWALKGTEVLSVDARAPCRTWHDAGGDEKRPRPRGGDSAFLGTAQQPRHRLQDVRANYMALNSPEGIWPARRASAAWARTAARSAVDL
jgi:hypothetical protein